jgi:lipopolysaccharide/colanic/teichoic acid biosynthesis glycosyltransferase
VNLRRPSNLKDIEFLRKQPSSGANAGVLNAESFHRIIALERKRTERSRKPFLLMLLDTGNCLPTAQNGTLLSEILPLLLVSTRETDVTGWYKSSSVGGVMFTEIGNEDRASIVSAMMARVSAILHGSLSIEQFKQISISFHLFPEDWNRDISQHPSNPAFYPDLVGRDRTIKVSSVVKRMMDVAGSALALVVLAPLFFAIAIAIKILSKGPVFFRQKRIGQYGRCFVFLKFRSMCVSNDTSVHEKYVRELIAGQAERHGSNGNGEGVYKLTDDPRVTFVGNFLRRTSLDELPQFLNVFKGEMSLVGPRPPIPYEVGAYDLWHRRRFLDVKPGMTGLWQVSGRNRINFDDMVRLDLTYATTWSPWLDIKILMRTPRAVLEGAH